MDIRQTESFKERQKKMLREEAKKELSAVHILTQFYRAEELRAKVYENNPVGSQGIMLGFTVIAIGLSSLSYTGRARKAFPRFFAIFGNSLITKGLIVYVCAYFGRFIEQLNIEYRYQKDAFKEYMSAHNYYERLKDRKLQSISYAKRIELLTGFKLASPSIEENKKKEEMEEDTKTQNK